MEWHTEQEMRDIWLQNNGNNTEGMPDFEYYEFENNLLINYYVYMTCFSQGNFMKISSYFKFGKNIGLWVIASCNNEVLLLINLSLINRAWSETSTNLDFFSFGKFYGEQNV